MHLVINEKSFTIWECKTFVRSKKKLNIYHTISNISTHLILFYLMFLLLNLKKISICLVDDVLETDNMISFSAHP